MRLGDMLMAPRLLKGILYDLEMTLPQSADETLLDELADSVNAERLNNHPVPMTKDELKSAYKKAMTPM